MRRRGGAALGGGEGGTRFLALMDGGGMSVRTCADGVEIFALFYVGKADAAREIKFGQGAATKDRSQYGPLPITISLTPGLDNARPSLQRFKAKAPLDFYLLGPIVLALVSVGQARVAQWRVLPPRALNDRLRMPGRCCAVDGSDTSCCALRGRSCFRHLRL